MNSKTKTTKTSKRSSAEITAEAASSWSNPFDDKCVSLLIVKEEDEYLSKNSRIKSKSLENLRTVKSVNVNDLSQSHERSLPITFKECHIAKDTTEISIIKDSIIDPSDLEQKGWSRFFGIFLALVAALQFSISALIIKVLGYHPFNLGVWRFGVMAIIPLPFLVHSVVRGGKESIFENIWPLSLKTKLFILLQAIFGANSIVFFFFGLKFLSMADCIVIGTSAPVFVTFFAFIFLGERCGLFPVATALFTLVGVGIISKPPILTGAESLNEETMIGVSASFSCMMLLTVFYIVIRYLRNVHHALLSLCFGLWGFVQSLLMAYMMDVLEKPKNYQQFGLIIVSALLAFSAQTCITLALKYEQAGPVALVRTSEVVFAFWWQAIFLGVVPDVFSVVGAVVTLSGVALTALRKMISSLPDDHKYKKWFGFLLF